MTMRADLPKLLVALALSLLALAAVTVGSAAAAGDVAWSVQAPAEPTSFSPADNAGCELESQLCDHYVVSVGNIGADPSSETEALTVIDTLPPGVLTASYGPSAPGWNCGGGAAQSVVTCTRESAVPALTHVSFIKIPVIVSAAPGELVNRVEVSGGGASRSIVAATPTPIQAPPTPFGVLDSSFDALALDSSGAPDTLAAGHPDAFTTGFAFPSIASTTGPQPVEAVKQIVTDLPPGLIGDARAAPTCSLADVTNFDEQTDPDACPPASRVGTLALLQTNSQHGEAKLSVFNIAPEHGYPAEFAVFLPSVQRTGLLYASVVGSGANAHVRVTSAPLPRIYDGIEIAGISLNLFGDPAVNDATGNTQAAFFTNPADCAATGFTSTIHVDSWQHPGSFLPDGEPNLADENWKSAEATAPPVTGCEDLHFAPSLSVQPTNTAPDSPTGLNVNLTVPQNENPQGLATPPLKDATVALPQGVTVSPSAANGLQACSEEQAALSTNPNQPASCPQASQVATVTVHTPILQEPLEGQLYLLSPECSPCSNADAQAGRLARGFIQVHSDLYGITLKIPGTISINPSTGQLTGTFDNNPQQPFTSLELHFPQSEHAVVSTPNSCGEYTTTSDFVPWSTPQTPDATSSSSFAISGCGGGGFGPSFLAGTTSSQAGAYSPFTLTFSRNDGEQDLGDVEQTLPPGLLAKLAGVQQCGNAEAASGNCPAGSQIGSVTVAAGPGSEPFYTTGSIYLTGPYNGGPFGEVVVVQAVAGPFNLGTVAVRGAIRINPSTAQATVVSDPFPSTLAGIPLQIRSVAVDLERAGFTFNPTGCNQAAVTGKLVSTQGAAANVATPFQAKNCANLPFKPVFTASVAGRASKANGASLTVKVTSKGGPGTAGEEANIKSVKVDLPIQLPSRLSTLQKACVAKVFEEDPANCPSASDVGTATANTPLLGVPLSGPAYLVSHGGEAFPDLEIVLQGEGVKLILDGNTQIKKGITSSTFKTIPDAPISSFELKLPTGKYSILGANVPTGAHYNLCGQTLAMATAITGQNGAVVKQSTKIAVAGCAAAKKSAKKARGKRGKKK